MKVKELIEILQKCDPEIPVAVEGKFDNPWLLLTYWQRPERANSLAGEITYNVSPDYKDGFHRLLIIKRADDSKWIKMK